MKLSKFIILLTLITITSLFYVHQEIELVKYSYKAQSNQAKLDDLLDQRKNLEYNVIALKVPRNLEYQLKANNIELVMPERWQVVNVAGLVKGKTEEKERSLPYLYAFLKFFASGREAQATPAN